VPDRPPLLFLHGAFAGASIWRRFVAPWFAARGHVVATPELPGPGAPAQARLRDYVRTARAAADALGGAPVVIGHSLGGFVAQHLAAERRLPGLVLVAAPGPAGLSPAFWRLAGRSKVLAALMLAQAGLGDMLGPEAARAALFTAETPEDWIRAHAPRPGAESPLALADGMLWDLPAWPRVWGTPVLAIGADRDAFIPMTDLMALQWGYGADVAVMRDMAHGMPIDPRWKRVAWRIGAWLEERRIGARAQPRLAHRA
jgi:non-heme chloroperoxidase